MSPREPPWYRQFWPWFLIALPASAVAGSLLSAWLALRYPEVIYDPPQPGADSQPAGHGDG
jgi:hypothetical protein